MSELDRIVESALDDWDASAKPLDWKNAEIALRVAALEAVRRCVEDVRAEPSFCDSCAGATARAFIAAILRAFPEAQP